MNNKEFATTNTAADPVAIFPDGISLFLVLGFSESNLLSASLLKPIAAFRAKIMHRIIKRKDLILKSSSGLDIARENPIKAKGIANTV